MDYINLLGLTAGCLTTVSFLPQVVKTWKSRSADDISSGMFALFSAGVLLWLLYGLELGALPIIIANTITLTKTHTKHTHKNRKQHKQPKRRRPRVHPSLFLPRRIEEGEARVAHAVRDLRQRRGIKQMQSRNRVLTSSHTPPTTSISLKQQHMRSNDSPRCKAGSSKFTGARRASRSSLPVNRTPPASSAAISNSMKRLSAGASQRNGTRIGTPVLRSFCNST